MARGKVRAGSRVRAAVWCQCFLAGLVALTGAAVAQQGLDFFTVTPCRVYDSRWGQGPMSGGFDRYIPVGGYCGIPPDASAASFNVTAVNPTSDGLLRSYPCCAVGPNVVVGFRGGVTRAGMATLSLGTSGQIAAFVDAPFSTTADVIVDVSGYFRPSGTVQQWREWEATLISPQDYTLNDGDPYSEVELDVRFTKSGTGETFVQPAFWDGEDGDPRTFKVRAAFPPGIWSWQIENCTRLGASCAAGWVPSTGSIAVQSNTSSGNPLYDRGFLKQFETKSGGEVVALSHLAFPDGTQFTWVGDTAWAAPPREIAGQTAAWDAYLADREAKGFNLIQLAPAVTWKPQPGQSWLGLPDARGFSFKFNSKPGCTPQTPIPSATCWSPRKPYWKEFTAMVKKAHEHGMVVAVMGMMNPTGIDPDDPYPSANRAFVRDLTGRLGGFSVIYSPAFDDDRRQKDPDPPAGTGQPRSELMNAVGRLLKELVKPISPGVRPITNHLAGGRSNCDDYRSFALQTDRWMTYYMFQSGHGGSNVPPGPCAPTGGTDVERAMERARVMSLTLDSYTNPSLPAVNSEGPYDATDFAPPNPNVDTRYRSRQAAYLSALSNAGGYTYGAIGLSLWDRPGNIANEIQRYYSLPSSSDMRHFASTFRGHKLVAQHEWIFNNPTAQRYRQALASDEVGLIIAYLPGDEPISPQVASNQIRIDASRLPCQVCPSQNEAPWSFSWVNPVSNTVVTGGSCSGPAGGQLVFTRPLCVTDPPAQANPNCDWVLKLERTTGSCPSGGGASSSAAEASRGVETVGSGLPAIEVWSDDSAGDGSSAIYAASHGRTGRGEPILLSPPGRAFQTAPRVGRVGDKQLVVWQADGLDGSLYGIYGALVGPKGEIEGPFKINHYTEHDQREPAVVGGFGGSALVVWSSYDQDGDRGGIFGRFVHTTGRQSDVVQDFFGEEIQITEETAGHQQHPQVVADAGGFWVAWETVDGNGLRSALSLRRLGLDGKPEAREVRLPAPPGEQRKLVAIEGPTPGSVLVRWWGQDARGGQSRDLRQTIGPQGPLTPVTPGGK